MPETRYVFVQFKVFFTICTKNMFGLIPEHVGYRARFDTYHGKADEDLGPNIVDIKKIYRSIFDVRGMVEGANSLSYNIAAGTGKDRAVFGYRYDVLENKGLVHYCEEPLWLDALCINSVKEILSKKSIFSWHAKGFGMPQS